MGFDPLELRHSTLAQEEPHWSQDEVSHLAFGLGVQFVATSVTACSADGAICIAEDFACGNDWRNFVLVGAARG